MRRTITLLATTLVVAAAITGSASAAALYTNAAHTTLVPVGPTVIGATGSTQMFLRGGSPVVVCQGVTVGFKVTQNSGGVVKLAITNRVYGGCSQAGWGASGGTLQISGSAITVGSTKAWLSTTLTGGTVGSLAENLISATGNPPVNGVFSQQPISGASPVSIVMNNAGTLTGAGGAAWTENGGFTLSGSYSLG
jgi:hypothetical protein